MRQLGQQLEQLAYRAMGAAIEVHRLLGPGFLESMYQESLEVEFRMRGIACHPKKPVAITYKGYSVGLFKMTKNTLDLPIDFNVPLLKEGIKRIIIS